jgi:riboflavin synthase
MFTGIIEELGVVERLQAVGGRGGHRLRLAAGKVLDGAHVGDSLAVNGCCLTVTAFGAGWWEADVSDETMRRTTLGRLEPGDAVNLERPVRLDDRLGGHLVQGHVDGVGEVVAPAPDLSVRMPSNLLRYVVEKGSISVDGVSLTVVEPTPDGFTVAVIPHTAEVTTLGRRRPGDGVNLEVDVIVKYVERLLTWHDESAKPGTASPIGRPRSSSDDRPDAS